MGDNWKIYKPLIIGFLISALFGALAYLFFFPDKTEFIVAPWWFWVTFGVWALVNVELVFISLVNEHQYNNNKKKFNLGEAKLASFGASLLGSFVAFFGGVGLAAAIGWLSRNFGTFVIGLLKGLGIILLCIVAAAVFFIAIYAYIRMNYNYAEKRLGKGKVK